MSRVIKDYDNLFSKLSKITFFINICFISIYYGCKIYPNRNLRSVMVKLYRDSLVKVI